MIDTKSVLILKILHSQCKIGGYKVVEKTDIISMLPAKYKCDIEELEHILSYLERQDCLNIKYDDDDVVCLCVLPYSNDVLMPKKKKNQPVSLYFIIFLITLIASFFGSFLASILKSS